MRHQIWKIGHLISHVHYLIVLLPKSNSHLLIQVDVFDNHLHGKEGAFYIAVDSRERTIPLYLYEKLGNIRRMRLEIGDVAIKSSFSNIVVIENKTFYDLLCSYATGRLQKQLCALQNSDYVYWFLFVYMEKRRKRQGRTSYSPTFQSIVLAYVHQIPSMYPKIRVEIFKEVSEIVLCVEELFSYIVKHV